MPPKAKGKGRKAGAGAKKKNSSPGESQWVKAGAPACPRPQYTRGVLRGNPASWATRWSGFVLVLSFLPLTLGHYGTQASLKCILRVFLVLGLPGAHTRHCHLSWLK